jgi:GAF domain-containing protein
VSNEPSNTDRLTALERELSQEQRARQVLVAASIRLNSLHNLPDLLNAIIEAATDLLEAESGALMLLDEDTNELVFEVATGASGTVVEQLRMPADKGIAGWVLTHNEPAIVDHTASDPRFYLSGLSTRSLLAVPLQIRDTMIGVVEVVNKKNERVFTAWDQELALALAAQAAVAIDNARLYQKLADALVTSRMSYRL